MIHYFKIEIKPEIHINPDESVIRRLHVQVRVDRRVYEETQVLIQFDTENRIDALFRFAKAHLLEAMKKDEESGLLSRKEKL